MELTLEQALQKGVEAHKAGKAQEADRYYTVILKANPKHPDANHNMGVLAVGVGKVQEALPFLKTALEVNPNIAQYWLSYINALIKLDRLDDAKAVLNQAKSNGAKGDKFNQIELQLNTSSVGAQNETQADVSTPPNILDELKLDKALQLAKMKVKDGLSEDAKKIYQDILKKFPKNKKASDGIRTLAGNTLANTSEMQEPPGNQLQGLVNLYRQGQYQEALDKASQLIEKFPNSLNLFNIIGAANQGLGKLEEAIEAYSKAISIKPDYAEAYYNMGNAFKDQGKLEEAVEAYNKALSIKPDYAETYNNIGLALKEQGKLKEAMAAYTKALTIKPDLALAHNNLGNALQEQGKLEEAIEAYSKAISIKPDYAEAYYNMGNAFKDQGKLEEAVEAYNKALSIKPDYAVTYNNIGLALKEQGKLNEAIEAYTKALAIKPDLAETFNNMGNALQEQGKLERAIETYTKALELKPDDAGAYTNIGNTLQEQGKLERAIEAYTKALELKPDDAVTTTNLALLLFESERFEKAARLFSMDDSIKSQSYLLKCFYELDTKSKFSKQLDYLIKRGENNCVIGSYACRAAIRYGIDSENPFCNDPLQYVKKIDLTKECDFQKVFAKNVANVLSSDEVSNKSQGLLKNGSQTAGNIFTQVGSVTNMWQDIIKTELKKYKDCFCDSDEGLIRDWPSDYSLYGWLVSMKNGGELSAHIHEKGWVSGSIYINVPPKSKEDSGNLVVTSDDAKHGKGDPRDTKSIDVVTGSLCLFPSSLLHYTIPFESNEDRTVLAFDMIPN